MEDIHVHKYFEKDRDLDRSCRANSRASRLSSTSGDRGWLTLGAPLLNPNHIPPSRRPDIHNVSRPVGDHVNGLLNANAMATTTTQILFNSPALHSLKRDQLVKLCKIHSIKANGKNSELIERLKQRAAELPPEEEDPQADEDADMDVDGIPGGMPVDPAPTSDNTDTDISMNAGTSHPNMNANANMDGYGNETGSEDEDCEMEMQDVVLTSRFSIPRPSEQWEVVMEDIAEVDETMGTASSKDSLRTVSGGEFGTQSSKGECFRSHCTGFLCFRTFSFVRFHFRRLEAVLLLSMVTVD